MLDGRSQATRSPALLILVLCGMVLQAHAARRPTHYHVQATAFCLHGTTAAGTVSHTGTAAADPTFLPMGTTIRLNDAGIYSGVYQITDTGRKVKGRHIDLRVASPSAAKKFGNRTVWIQVLKWG